MAIHIIRADLSNLPFNVDFIVNTANPEPKVGKGLDKAIFEKAGPMMLEERRKIGHIAPGDIAITNAYGLNAKKVIHAVSVAWTDGFHDEAACVQKCYHRSLAAAVDYMHNHQLLSVSIALPLIGTGIYQIPMEISLSLAVSESTLFALKHNMEIFLVVFNEASVTAMKKVFPVEEYLTYSESREILNYEYSKKLIYESPEDIHESIKQSHYFRNRMQPKGFVDLLIGYMNERKMDGPEIYTAIHLSRQSFSDFLSGKKTPRKEVVILIAIRLKLSLTEMEEFLEKAGHSLSDDKEEDRLTKTFFASQNYDVIEYNKMRIEHGLSATRGFNLT